MTARSRILTRRLHLWLGLGLGLLFVLLGLTGSALIFHVEIDRALNPVIAEASVAPAPGWSSPTWDRALATGRTRWPNRTGKWTFEATGEPGPIPARYYPSGTHGHHAHREMLWFSADGTRLLRAEPWGDYLMSWIYQLHMNLLAGDPGGLVVGWSGIAMLVLLITGLLAWWPRGSWRKAVVFKRDAAPIRRLRDLHKLSGLWSLALIFILVATGVLLALPAIKTQLLTATIATPDPVPAPRSTGAKGPQISVSAALAAARQALPGTRLAFIDVPATGSAPFRIRVQVPGDPHARFPGSYVFIDQHSGAVLAVHDIRRGNAATATASWIRVLHDGSVGGLSTRILAVIIGLAPAMLFFTGLLHWQRRRRSGRPAQFKTTTNTKGIPNHA